MPLEIWTGGPFEHSKERATQDALVAALSKHFAGALETVLAVFNVSAQRADMDLLILKHDSVIVVDFKHCGKPIRAKTNGAWEIEGGGKLPGNPYRQLRAFRYALNDFLFVHRAEFLRQQKAETLTDDKFFLDFISGVVAMCPRLYSKSRNLEQPPPWFHLTGLDVLAKKIGQITSRKFALDDAELHALVETVFKCDRVAVEESSHQSGALEPAEPIEPELEGPSAEPRKTSVPSGTQESSTAVKSPNVWFTKWRGAAYALIGLILLLVGILAVSKYTPLQRHAADRQVVSQPVDHAPGESTAASPPEPRPVVPSSSQTSTDKPPERPIKPKEQAPTPPLASQQDPARDKEFRRLINTNLSLSTSEPNVAFLIDFSGSAIGLLAASLQDSLGDSGGFRLIGNLAYVKALKVGGYFDDLYAGNGHLLTEAFAMSGVDYILLAKAASSFHRQQDPDPRLITCDLTLACKLFDRKGTVIRIRSFSVAGAGLSDAEVSNRAIETFVQQVREKMLDVIRR